MSNVRPAHIALEQRLSVMLINAFHALRTVSAKLKVQVHLTVAQASACDVRRVLIVPVIRLFAAQISVSSVQAMLSVKPGIATILTVVRANVCNVQKIHTARERRSVSQMFAGSVHERKAGLSLLNNHFLCPMHA